MSSPTQITPFLTALVDDGDFTLRVDNSPFALKLSSIIAKEIGQLGARKLTVITPTDLKVFKLDSPKLSTAAHPVEKAPAPTTSSPVGAVEPAAPPAIYQDGSAPASPELADYEREMAEAAQAAADLARMNGEVVEFPTAPVPEPAAPRPRKNQRPTPNVPATPCGRCAGAGQVAGGSACPVCRGAGVIAHFGRRSR